MLEKFLSFAPNSLRLGNAKQVCRFSRLAEFIIFNKYRDVAEKSVKEYLEYFATSKATSKGTQDVERQRQWYLSDNETRKRYMTWQQEIDDAVYEERERTKAAERRADEEKSRADEAESRADKAESRAERYEKILKEHGLL